MIKIENDEIFGLQHAIRGMRNPLNSWHLSDSSNLYDAFCVGKADHKLMKCLVKGGSDHSKFMRMIAVYVDITAPLYWWKEFDTYKVGTVANSCSTMHKIHAKEFCRDDFSVEHIDNMGGEERHWMVCMDNVIAALNVARTRYLETKDKKYWWQMIQLLPSSYNQKRTVMLNYAVLRNMYHARKNHKLDEWRKFCEWVEFLPYSDLITEDFKDEQNS